MSGYDKRDDQPLGWQVRLAMIALFLLFAAPTILGMASYLFHDRPAGDRLHQANIDRNQP